MRAHKHTWKVCDCPACPGCYCYCGAGRSQELREAKSQSAHDDHAHFAAVQSALSDLLTEVEISGVEYPACAKARALLEAKP
jgi:hypothetical protein